MELYTPVLALALLAAGFAVMSVVMSAVVGPKRYNRAKLDSYECGIEPTPQPVGGGRFPVKYYITAMLFIIFDIEIIFLYPWAVHFDAMRFFGLVEMVIFIATVFVAYAYVWRRGGLDGTEPAMHTAPPAATLKESNGNRRKAPSAGCCSPPSRASPATCARRPSGRPPSAWPAAPSR